MNNEMKITLSKKKVRNLLSVGEEKVLSMFITQIAV